MNPLIALGQTIFEWTWKTSLYATLLMVVVFGLQKVLAKWLTPRLRYSLSLVVLIRLLLPMTLPSGWSFENLCPLDDRVAITAAVVRVSNISAVDLPLTWQTHNTPVPLPAEDFPVSVPMGVVLGIVWALGCLGLLSLAGWRFGKWNHLIREGRQISDPRLLQLLNAARETMRVRQPVVLVAIAQLNSPAVFGFWKTRLLLPETLPQDLNDEELRMIFLHEMAHVRRKDLPLNFLLMAVQFLHWFNPMVWLALHRLRADRELVCDDMVMRKVKPEERLDYGQLLLKLADGFSTGKPVFSGAVPVISGIAELKRRLLTIKHHRSASLAACAVTALVVVVLVMGAFTHASGWKQVTAKMNSNPVRRFEYGGPYYHGQPLGHWTIKLKQGNRQEQAEAQAALHALGKKAIPFLVHSLAQEDVMFQWRYFAASALGEIGPPASNAIPALLDMTNNMPSSEMSFSQAPVAALMKIRGKPIEGLIRAADDPNSAQWVATAQTLAEFGTKAAPAIPALCQALHSEKSWAAAYAIGFIHSQPEIAVPALIDTVKRHDLSNFSGRQVGLGNILWALGQYEADARAAIPVLREHVQDADSMDRQTALLSLRKILPAGEVGTLVPALIQNVNVSDPNLRVVARYLLNEIDPAAAKKLGVRE